MVAKKPFNRADWSGEVYLISDFCFSLPVGMAHTNTIPLVKEINMRTTYPRFSYALSHVVFYLEASCVIIFTVANPFWQSPIVLGIVSKNWANKTTFYEEKQLSYVFVCSWVVFPGLVPIFTDAGDRI